jgi:hypothetical protein
MTNTGRQHQTPWTARCARRDEIMACRLAETIAFSSLRAWHGMAIQEIMNSVAGELPYHWILSQIQNREVTKDSSFQERHCFKII